ncbi:DUF742 domain-containing protein [Saccharopolyspora griseoalba]|uniref:DUF742 domain-containing protein n=1 Tax=Saccharopolyspora griseoalba TaxID=1431848 RepID=A0ABW2LSZ0_9PSEU
MPSDDQLWLDDDSGPLVRPYAMTRGRTRPARPELDVVTQLLTVRRGDPRNLPVEHDEILRLCARPLSIAEVASYLDTPMVVVKVLVSDLIDQGMLTTDAKTRARGRPNRQLLEAVLDGMRRL